MSFAATKWALAQDATLTGPTRWVLIVLAWHASSDDLAWPSVGTVSREAGIASRSVQRALRELATTGLIEPVERTLSGTVRYRLKTTTEGRQTDGGATESHPRQSVTPGVTDSRLGGDTESPELKGTATELTDPPKPPQRGDFKGRRDEFRQAQRDHEVATARWRESLIAAFAERAPHLSDADRRFWLDAALKIRGGDSTPAEVVAYAQSRAEANAALPDEEAAA